MEKYTAVLNDWSWDEVYPVIWGIISGDEKRRWREGTLIHTSAIDKNKFGDCKEGDIVQTLNSSYLLGNPK